MSTTRLRTCIFRRAELLKDRIVKYLTTRPGVKINGGEIERLALAAGYKASNASRRCRELREEGIIKDQEIKGTVWYWYEKPPTVPTDPDLERLFN